MHNTTQFMKSWSDTFVGNIRVQLEIAKEVVHWLEFARDRRHVLAHEEVLRKKLNLQSLGLAFLQCSKLRLLWLKEGDTLTHFFHIHANSRHCKKFIPTLKHDGRTLVAEGSNVTPLVPLDQL
jgi:hypothetical protein